MRSFKTDRSIAAELRRNPSVAARLRTAFSGHPQKFESELTNSSETLKKLIEKSSESSSGKGLVFIFL